MVRSPPGIRDAPSPGGAVLPPPLQKRCAAPRRMCQSAAAPGDAAIPAMGCAVFARQRGADWRRRGSRPCRHFGDVALGARGGFRPPPTGLCPSWAAPPGRAKRLAPSLFAPTRLPRRRTAAPLPRRDRGAATTLPLPPGGDGAREQPHLAPCQRRCRRAETARASSLTGRHVSAPTDLRTAGR